MNRPDFSQYIAHFNKNSSRGMAIDNLVNILRNKVIEASSMPWTDARAVCFTECPWSSILAHTEKYSPYGIGFHKATVYAKHGGPVYYIRPDHYQMQKDNGGFDSRVLPFLTPFSPAYRPDNLNDDRWNHTVDYTQEREWRVPHDFPFDYKDIKFVILPDYKTMAEFHKDFKDIIGRENFILLDNYKRIEELWPVHIQ